MDENKSSFGIIIFFLVVIGAFAWFIYKGISDEEEAVIEDETSNVTVIEEDDQEEVENVEDTEEIEETDDTEELNEEDEIDETEDEETIVVESEMSEDGVQSLGEGLASDGASVDKYAYWTEGGQFIFTWTVSANPKVTAGYDEEGDSLIVEFKSLSRDSIAREEETKDLGQKLFELTWAPYEDGSRYIFEVGSENDFEFVYTEETKELKLTISL